MGTSGQAEEIVTHDDVVILNRAVVARAAVMARLVGSALIVLAAVAAAAWAWLVVRQQVTMDDASAFPGGGFEDLSIGQRVDLFANILPYLVYAGLALGAGIGLRLLADYAQARTGGSLTGYEPGDTLPDPDPERDDYAPPPVPAD